MTYNVFGGTLNLTQSISYTSTVMLIDVGQIWLVIDWLIDLTDNKRPCNGARRSIYVHMEHGARFFDDNARVLAVSRQVSILLAPSGRWRWHQQFVVIHRRRVCDWSQSVLFRFTSTSANESS